MARGLLSMPLPCVSRHPPGVQPVPGGLLRGHRERKQPRSLPEPGCGRSPSRVSRGTRGECMVFWGPSWGLGLDGDRGQLGSLVQVEGLRVKA